jgi:two-component system response regulator HydG
MNNVSSYRLSPRSAPPAFTTPDSGRHSLLGASPSMQEVLRLIERVGPTEASVLLTGEIGSGKELAARSIHECSARRNMPFVAISCGAIPAALLEAEFERAMGGTLLLDDITEMSMEVQTQLLRILESSARSSSGVRVIAATHRDPLAAVQTGQLREDLLYRLAVFPIELPPLRSRGDDVELLADHFLAALNARSGTQKRFSVGARDNLKTHTWPGNVREMKNCVERAFILNDDLLELAPLIQGTRSELAPESASRERLEIRVGSRIHDMERSLIEATLDYFKGNKRRAADALGCSLKTLYNKLNGYSSQNQELANT